MSQDCTGLAFSGGGIRSAAFCSGVLRRLLESGVEVDYLSCVSGGGYTGTAYLDWKYHEERKARNERRDWHEEFFNHMKQRTGHICDWTKLWRGILDTIVFIGLMTLVIVIQPLVRWGAYAFPVAFIIDFFVGKWMRRSADCDVALERQREMNASAVPDIDFIDRCLSGSHQRDIAVKLFLPLFVFFVASYGLSRSRKVNRSCWGVFVLLCEYISGGLLLFTFLPFAIYDFLAKIPRWTQIFVGIIAVIVWVTIPVMRRKTSYLLIVYIYSFVIYWKVFKIDLPVVLISYEDDLFHWLLCASGIVLLISPFTTALQERLVHVYNRWRLQKAFYHKKSTGRCGCSGIGLRHVCPLWLGCCLCVSENASDTEARPLTLADLKDVRPEYLSNIVVNRWKKSDGDRVNYALLTMSPTGIERFDQHGENQFKGKLGPGDIMLSDAMATSAAALSNHMGKYEGSIEGLTRLHTILGLEMGATVTSDEKHVKGCCEKILAYFLHLFRGVFLIIPTLCQLINPSYFERVLLISMAAFVLMHFILAIIAAIDTGVDETKWWEKMARWFIVHNSFVYNARLLFSKDNIGPTPPAVLLLSDGGHYENLAILPLLQRKLKRIVVVDGGYKHEEEAYGDSILDALMLARTELNCSFYGEDGKDVITDLMQMFVKPEREGKPRYYKFKVHYGKEYDNDQESDGEIILLVPRRETEGSENQKRAEEITLCCCECCHSKCCSGLSKCLCNAFPQHSTANQFFTPRMFSAYHEEGRRACEEAEADEFLKNLYALQVM